MRNINGNVMGLLKNHKCLLAILFLLFLTGCSALKPDEAFILNTVKTEMAAHFGQNEIIDSIEITESSTDEVSNDEVYSCTVFSYDADSAYKKYFMFSYQKEGNRYQLISSLPDPSYSWEAKPLRGPGLKTLKEAVLDWKCRIGEEEWEIKDESIIDIVIDSQKTSLKSREDSTDFSITVQTDSGSKAQARIHMNLAYEKEVGWYCVDFEILESWEYV